MINHKGSFYLGVFVFIIPFLGFPTIWKMGLVVVSGLILILTSIRIPVPRKTIKNKIKNEEPRPVVEVPKVEPVVAPKIEHKIEQPEVAPPIVIIKKTKKVSSKVDLVRKSNTKNKETIK